MSQCWNLGDLRAHLDGELSPNEANAIASHLEQCAECRSEYSELSKRARMVDDCLAALDVPAQSKTQPSKSPRRTYRYVAAALALAAGVAIGYLTMPKHDGGPVRTGIVPSAPTAAVQTPVVIPPRPETPLPVRGRRAASDAVYYTPLDDEPIETGTIMRVGLADSNVEAELLLGPDGRAHAIRLVSIK
jgi:anti-sigma factor RsiW